MNKTNNQHYNELLNKAAEGSWYKQGWAWFVLLPLIAVVFMGIGLLVVAINTQDSIVIDDYYKEGLAINQIKDAEQQAYKLNINTNLWLDDLTGEVRAELSGNTEPDSLTLKFYHPTLKNKDFQLLLKVGTKGVYFGQLQSQLKGKWYLVIEPGAVLLEQNQPWRLKAELNLPLTTPITIQAAD
ncbi:MAG: hypothetical protein ACI9N9_001493 [Enterobacterales bacterium]|jgi:hypothetical protein